MTFNDLLENRKSMRNYGEGPDIGEDVIREIIEAAVLAPSWKNYQTSRYYAIMGEGKVRDFAEKCLPEFNRKNCDNAKAIIVTSFKKDRSGYNKKSGWPENECGNGWGYYDLGLASENILIKACEMGIDSLVMGIRDADVIKDLLSIPDDEIVVSVIALGYGNKEIERPRRKELDEVLRIFR